MTKFFIYGFFITILTAIGASAQGMSPMPNTKVNLETILSEAEKQAQNYQEEFKNLLANETKTFQTYDKYGKEKNKTVVESTFLVYQSPRNQQASAELRNVLKVNDELVPDSQKRSDQLFAELQKTSTLEKELEKIQSEGSRYDKTLEISGLTLIKAVTLSENLRPFFEYKLSGTEIYEGNEVYVVTYQQTRKSPFVNINQNQSDANGVKLNFKFDLPGKLKKADAFVRGKFWIDTKTYQILREDREVTVQTPDPVAVLQTTLIYQPSEYGIYVPKEIILVENILKKISNGNQYEPVTDIKATFNYTNFRKTDTDVKIIDDDQ